MNDVPGVRRVSDPPSALPNARVRVKDPPYRGGRAPLFLALMFSASAFANDPYELTTVARLERHALVLEITAARSTALALAAGGRESPMFEPAEFARHEAALRACAPGLFAVTANGKPLAARAASVQLVLEGDVEFRVTYPRPARGPLRLAAIHLPPLGHGFGNDVTLRSSDGAELARQLLMGADTTIECALPAEANPTTFRPALAASCLGFVAMIAWLAARRPRGKGSA
jgi:hypothetical protein